MPTLNRTFDRLSWTKQAACVGSTNLFFGYDNERYQTKNRREAKALLICQSCPVMLECRDYARENREYGYWGGESEHDRTRAGYAVVGYGGGYMRSYQSYLARRNLK